MICLFLVQVSCNKPVTYESFAGFAEGTTYSIIFENKGKFSPEGLKEEVEKILDEFDLSLSLYNEASILSKVNRNEDVITDDYFREAFDKSIAITELTGGAFDITVGPLVKAWGFGPEAHKNFSESGRDSLLRLVGMSKVKLVDGRVVKDDPGIQLDLNAIAKGYSVDVVSRYLTELGIKNHLVEIGGEVRVRGKKQGNPWRIGIDRPEDNNFIPGNDLQAIIMLQDRSLATSGNYRRFYVEDGVKYSHTIDPRTGYPARNPLLSATVLANDCATADAIATACMVMGKDKSIEFFGLHPEYDAFLIFSDEHGNYQVWMTEKLKSSIAGS